MAERFPQLGRPGPDLEAAYRQARRRWRRVSGDDHCWTDPLKRREMLLVRLAYQDAKLYRLFALRQAGQRGETSPPPASERPFSDGPEAQPRPE